MPWDPRYSHLAKTLQGTEGLQRPQTDQSFKWIDPLLESKFQKQFRWLSTLCPSWVLNSSQSIHLKNCDLWETKGKCDGWISVPHFLWWMQSFICVCAFNNLVRRRFPGGARGRPRGGVFLLVWKLEYLKLKRHKKVMGGEIVSVLVLGLYLAWGCHCKPHLWYCGRRSNKFVLDCGSEQPLKSQFLTATLG